MGKYSLFNSMSMLEQWLLNTQDQLFILAYGGGSLILSLIILLIGDWLIKRTKANHLAKIWRGDSQ